VTRPHTGGESDASNVSNAGGGPGGIIDEIRLAAAFLTIVPAISNRRFDDRTIANSFGWFPLIGFILGAALALEDRLLATLFDTAIRSVLVIATLTALTGAIHVDALADAADALGAGRERERALEIMRDSRIGSFGAAAIFIALALEIVALVSIPDGRRFAALIVAPGLARWVMVAVSYRLEYLRAAGAGSTILARDGARNLALASVTTMAALFCFASWRMLSAAALAIVVALAMRAFYRRWIGGVTGDLIGAAGELATVAVLLTIAAR